MKAVTRQLACASASLRGLIRRTTRPGTMRIGTTRLALAALLLTAGGSLPGGPVAPAAAAREAVPAQEITSLRPEVRLRKLHLVRPDLIQYPLAYDVIC